MLLSWIRDHHLGTGDQLPPHSFLCKKLRIGGVTLSLAMAMLVESGLLHRKRRVGTIIADMEAIPPKIWNVGVASFVVSGQGSGSYFAEVTHRLLAELGTAGLRTHAHILPSKSESTPPNLNQYTELLHELHSQSIDALITATEIDTARLIREYPKISQRAIVYIGVEPTWQNNVLIDQHAMSRQAVSILNKLGCKKLGVVSISGFQKQATPPPFWKGFQAGLADVGLNTKSGESLHAGFGFAGARIIAKEPLERRPADRPDGLIIVDDWIALGLTSILKQTSDYRPQIVVQTNRQAALTFSLPVIQLEVDIDQLVRSAVSMVIELLRSGKTAGLTALVEPKLFTRAEVDSVMN